jgi:hypothetical protein
MGEYRREKSIICRISTEIHVRGEGDRFDGTARNS